MISSPRPVAARTYPTGKGGAQIRRRIPDLGDKEHAFEWLNTAYQEHDFLLESVRTDFTLDSLRSAPGYAELIRKIGLPQ